MELGVEKEEMYLSLGCNRGQCIQTLISTLGIIHQTWRISAASSLYRTKPQIVTDQEDFFNLAISCPLPVESSPDEVLSIIHKIEAQFGRNRSSEQSKGPRPIDIDIVFWGTRIIKNQQLTIPHENFHTRRFVLVPILEIDNEMRDPRNGVYLREYDRALQTDPLQGIYPYESHQYNTFTSNLRIGP